MRAGPGLTPGNMILWRVSEWIPINPCTRIRWSAGVRQFVKLLSPAGRLGNRRSIPSRCKIFSVFERSQNDSGAHAPFSVGRLKFFHRVKRPVSKDEHSNNMAWTICWTLLIGQLRAPFCFT